MNLRGSRSKARVVLEETMETVTKRSEHAEPLEFKVLVLEQALLEAVAELHEALKSRDKWREHNSWLASEANRQRDRAEEAEALARRLAAGEDADVSGVEISSQQRVLEKQVTVLEESLARVVTARKHLTKENTELATKSARLFNDLEALESERVNLLSHVVELQQEVGRLNECLKNPYHYTVGQAHMKLVPEHFITLDRLPKHDELFEVLVGHVGAADQTAAVEKLLHERIAL